MKRGNLLAQPFVYILVLVTMALVLFFGVKSVRDIMMVSEDVQLGDLIIQLRNYVFLMSKFDVGSYKTFRYTVPTKVMRICFLNTETELSADGIDEFVAAVMEQSVNDNVFIEPFDAFTQESYTLASLWVDPRENPLCFFVQGKGAISLGLETVFDGTTLAVAVRRDAP